MKYALSATAMILALIAMAPGLKAADVPMMGPPPPPPPPPGPAGIIQPVAYPCFWNGFYVGGNLGVYMAQESNVTDTLLATNLAAGTAHVRHVGENHVAALQGHLFRSSSS